MPEDRNFQVMLKERWERGLFVCVGLDTDFPEAARRETIRLSEMINQHLKREG